MHIYTSSFFKFRNKANFYSFLGASAGTGAPRNTQKIGTQCGCEYGYKNYESFGSLKNFFLKEKGGAYCPLVGSIVGNPLLTEKTNSDKAGVSKPWVPFSTTRF